MPTRIEWTDESWNPVTGCTPVSEGCANCYARRMAKRLQAMGTPGYENEFDVTLHPDRLGQPLRWKKPRMIFVCSMGDLFHEDVPDKFIDKIFAVMAFCREHTFQVLTKRPERMREYLSCPTYSNRVAKIIFLNFAHQLICGQDWPSLPNVWLGTSASNRPELNENVKHLLQCPAAVRFVSIEPMLGPVDVSPYTGPYSCLQCGYVGANPGIEHCLNCEAVINSDEGCPECGPNAGYYELCPECGADSWGHATTEEGQVLLDWVIVGGETGPGARPMHPDWVRGVRDQCIAANVPFFFKQWGAWKRDLFGRVMDSHIVFAPDGTQLVLADLTDVGELNQARRLSDTCMSRVGKKAAGRLLDGQEWNEMPERKA